MISSVYWYPPEVSGIFSIKHRQNMSTTRDAFSPTGSWETQSEDMDDDMDYEVSEVAFHHHHNPTMKLESGEEEEKEKEKNTR